MNLRVVQRPGRSLDYVETRKDIDTGKLAYLGFSLGGAVGPLMIAVEPRFKVAILRFRGAPLKGSLPRSIPELCAPGQDPGSDAERA